jgi:hypothetical protein
MIEEIQGEDQDYLIDLIATYGEGLLIKYLSESILEKQRLLCDN